MDDSAIWKWLMNVAVILGGGLWLGSLQTRTSRNADDLKEIERRKADIDSIKELHSNTSQISDINVRVVRVEEQLKHQTSKLDEIHAAVMRK